MASGHTAYRSSNPNGNKSVPQLYDSLDARSKYGTEAFLSGVVPFYGAYKHATDSMRYMDDYIRNRGLSWDNIKYPTMTVGWQGMQRLGSATVELSKNILKLYRNG